MPTRAPARYLLLLAAIALLTTGLLRAQDVGESDAAQLPDAPSEVKALELSWVVPAGGSYGQKPLPGQKPNKPGPGPLPAPIEYGEIPGDAPALKNACPPTACSPAQTVMCCNSAAVSPFARYLQNPDAVPITAKDNFRSAVMDVADPFNLMTIAADAIFGIASDAHTAYGPGVGGVARYAGVSLTENITGEFFGTFLVPSIMHQDPHYHRVPFLSVKRRIWHSVSQVFWAQSYTGRPMFNYGNVVGGIATAAISNTFVPGPGRQGWGATAQRLSIAFAFAPTGNLIEEFVPDVARRINLRVVIFQRILNSVSLEVSGTGTQ